MSATGLTTSGKSEFIRQQLSDSLQRLGIECIDLYYQHRMDPATPIEETMNTLKELIAEGKIKYIGLSECTPEELRLAHSIHPVSAIQIEWSLQTRDVESALVPTARELGIGIVAYSPLGRGLLTGKIADALVENDWRLTQPRFSGENLGENMKSVEPIYAMAADKGVTPAQLALAWLYAQGNDVFPIPGTKSVTRLEENAGAVSIALTPSEIETLQSIPEGTGDRYDEMFGTFNQRL